MEIEKTSIFKLSTGLKSALKFTKEGNTSKKGQSCSTETTLILNTDSTFELFDQKIEFHTNKIENWRI